MANRFPLVLDTDAGNKIKELPSGDNLNLRESSIVNVQDINALGTINAADITVNGNRLVAQTFADLTDTPNSFAGAANYFVKVKEDGTGLEFRPFSDIGNIEVERIEVSEIVLPTASNAVDIGSDSAFFRTVRAVQFRGDLVAIDNTKVFDSTTGKISYAALEGAPQFLSEFTDDIGFLRTSDLDDALGGLFDQGVPFATDIKGSVFADDSTVIVDGVAGVIRGDTEYTGTGFIRGQTVVILADGYVQLGQTELLTTLEPETDGEGSIGTESRRFGNAYFNNINSPVVQTESVETGLGTGIGSITSSTDVEITAGNRVKINGAVPFRVSSTTDADQAGIAPQTGDLIYNTTQGRLQIYQNGAWVALHSGTFTGNVTAATGTSNFNDVVVAGNLTVSGTTTTVDTANTTIKDNIIVLNNGEAGAGVTAGTSGIEIDRGSEANKTLVWDDSVDKWTVGSEIFRAGTFEAVAFSGSLLYNGGQNAPLQIFSGQNGQTGNTIFINPYGSDTFLIQQAETYEWRTGPYLSSAGNPYLEFKTAGAFKAFNGAYFEGNLTGDVVGSVFADDSSVMVDAVNNHLVADKVITPLIEGPSNAVGIVGSLIALGSSHSITANAGPVTISSDSSSVILTGANGFGSISYDDSDGSINIGTTGVTTIQGAAGAAVNIGTGTSGTVTLGNGSNTIDVASGSTLDLNGVTVTNAAFNLTGNIDNTNLTLGATATNITVGHSSSTTTIEGTIQFTNALIANNLTADDSIIIRTLGNTANEAITIRAFGTNNAVNLTADNIRFFGPITEPIDAVAGITGDVKGSVFGDDSTLLVDAVNSVIPYAVLSGAPTALSEFNNDLDYAGIVGTTIQNNGLPTDTFMTGNLDAQSNDIIDANLVNATGNLTGDVKGSVFADDSSVMVDAVNFVMFSDALTLTPLNAEPTNFIAGTLVAADGVNWDPASKAGAVPYPVFYDGVAWNALY